MKGFQRTEPTKNRHTFNTRDKECNNATSDALCVGGSHRRLTEHATYLCRYVVAQRLNATYPCKVQEKNDFSPTVLGRWRCCLPQAGFMFTLAPTNRSNSIKQENRSTNHQTTCDRRQRVICRRINGHTYTHNFVD